MKISEYMDIIKEKQRKNYLPSSVTFELTPLCNFNCKMCYIHIKQNQGSGIPKLLSTEQWIALIKETAEAGVILVGFTGGEVFTRSDFRTIYETAYDLGLAITILSNGYLINDDIIHWLSEKKPDGLRITIYGASNETYKRVCGIENGFTVVTSNIKKLIDAKINVAISMTVTEENKNDLDAVKDYALNHHLQFMWADTIRKPVRGAEREVAHLRVKKSLPSIAEEEKEVAHVRDFFPFQTDDPFSSCRCYKRRCIFTWNGRMVGCNFINSISEDALQDDLITNFRRLWDRLSQLKMPEKCKKCKYLKFCNPCPGSLEGESGDPEMASDYVCELAKYRYYTRNLKVTADDKFKDDTCE